MPDFSEQYGAALTGDLGAARRRLLSGEPLGQPVMAAGDQITNAIVADIAKPGQELGDWWSQQGRPDAPGLGAAIGPAVAAAWNFLPGPKGMGTVGRAAEALAPEASAAGRAIRAYHGSPHDFDRFDSSFIGAGEGNQSYGRGLYFAENEGVAKGYRDTLTNNKFITEGLPSGSTNADYAAHALVKSTRSKEEAAKVAQSAVDSGRDTLYAGSFSDDPKAILSAIDRVPQPEIGHMYETRINADPDHFLHWDKPLSEQSEHVRNAIRPLVSPIADKAASYRNELYQKELQGWEAAQRDKIPGWQNYQRPKAPEIPSVDEYTGERVRSILRGRLSDDPTPTDVAASQTLRDAGIPGIKYLDQGSRSSWANEHGGTHNYVVFDDKLIDIMKKYGIGLGLGLGGASAMKSDAYADALRQ